MQAYRTFRLVEDPDLQQARREGRPTHKRPSDPPMKRAQRRRLKRSDRQRAQREDIIAAHLEVEDIDREWRELLADESDLWFDYDEDYGYSETDWR